MWLAPFFQKMTEHCVQNAGCGFVRGMNVTIIVALQEELDAFRCAHELTPAPRRGPFAAFQWCFRGTNVTVLQSGVGKVNAAMVAQFAVDRFGPDYLIVTGIAGALSSGLALGDVVVSRDCVQHDLDVSALGVPVGQVPRTGHRFLDGDPRLVALALATAVPGQRVVAGRILTGDQFIAAGDAGGQRRLRSLDGTAVEMEGAAIALVATVNRIPFVIVRSVSDHADGTAPADFRACMRRAAANSYTVCAGILAGLAGEPERDAD
jgi:5'-methylthioadenosine/S-adenosylhomocysteine nucleosidase